MRGALARSARALHLCVNGGRVDAAPQSRFQPPGAMTDAEYPADQIGKTSERLTWPRAKLLSMEAMLSSRVSLSLMNRS